MRRWISRKGEEGRWVDFIQHTGGGEEVSGHETWETAPHHGHIHRDWIETTNEGMRRENKERGVECRGEYICVKMNEFIYNLVST